MLSPLQFRGDYFAITMFILGNDKTSIRFLNFFIRNVDKHHILVYAFLFGKNLAQYEEVTTPSLIRTC